MKRTIIIALIVVVLAVGGYFGYQQYQRAQAAAQTTYQTQTITRGALTAIVGATGTVRANQTTTVGWQTTGRIDKINVKVGDPVNANQQLANLDQSSLPQSIILAQADLVTAKRNLENLKNSAMNQGNAQLALAQAEKGVADAQHDRDLLNYSRGQNGNADAAWAEYYLAVDTYNKTLDRYNKIQNRAIDDPARASLQTVLVAAQQKVQQKQAIVDWYTGAPTPNDVAQSDANLVIAKARLADAQREWDRLKNGPDPEDISAAESRVAAIEATLGMTTLETPFSGTVTDVRSMVGDQVTPTTISFRIDDLSRLLVDVQITEVDINRVKVGQPVKLSFDAISGKDFNGKVSAVAKVGTPTSGAVNFTVTVELTDATEEVRPAMTAAVNVVVDQLTDALLVPNRAVRLKAGQRVVYILRNNVLTSVPITIGSISDTFSEVQAGDIQEGDEAVLNPPIEFTTGSGGQPSFFGGR
jgi:HlyD family secretion protein